MCCGMVSGCDQRHFNNSDGVVRYFETSSLTISEVGGFADAKKTQSEDSHGKRTEILV